MFDIYNLLCEFVSIKILDDRQSLLELGYEHFFCQIGLSTPSLQAILVNLCFAGFLK